MSEFAFELALCAHLEQRREGVVARQLGASVADPGGRILDVVCVEPSPEFADRVALTAETIPDAAIESAIGAGQARYWKDAFDCHPDRARRATDRAIEIGFFERELRNGREYVRQVARYPDWYGRLVGIENKPDLGRPGDLEIQLRTDVSLAVVDEVVLATESYVTGAHLNRIPEEVGVWRVRRDDRCGSIADANSDVTESDASIEIEVVREPTPLPVDEPGIEPTDVQPGHTDIAVVSPEEKARSRRRIAERAYGKGWRTYAFPACRACEPSTDSGATLPDCQWKGRVVDARSECGPSCGGYEAGSSPDIDLAAEREARTPWRAEPTGTQTRQSGLDRFG